MISIKPVFFALSLTIALSFSSCAERFLERGGSPKIFFSHHPSSKQKESKYLEVHRYSTLKHDTIRYSHHIQIIPFDTLTKGTLLMPKAPMAQAIQRRGSLIGKIKTAYNSKASLNRLGTKETLQKAKSQNGQNGFSDQTILFQYSVWGILGSLLLLIIGASLFDVFSIGEGIMMAGAILLTICFVLFVLALLDNLFGWIFDGWYDMHWLWRFLIPPIAIASVLLLLAFTMFAGY